MYLISRDTIGNTAAVLAMIGLMMPFFFLAMYEKDGQPAEKALVNMLRARLWPPIRVFRTENLYKYLESGGVDSPAGYIGRPRHISNKTINGRRGTDAVTATKRKAAAKRNGRRDKSGKG